MRNCTKDDKVVVNSTSHHLKFAGFQQMFFDASFSDEYDIDVKQDYVNKPIALSPKAQEIAEYLGLKRIT